jgi:flagellar motor switch protein FliN/FliY
MSDGSLSQDEIDALLQETESLEIDTGFGGGAEPLSEAEKGQLLALLGGITDSQASSLNLLIRKHVTLGKPALELKTPGELAAELPPEVVEVKLDFTDGLKGEHSYLLPLDTAVSIAGSMMGQADVELDDAALSAVAEAVSQITGAATTGIGNQIARTIKTTPPAYQKAGPGGIRVPMGDSFVRLQYPITLEGESPSQLIELYSLSLAKEIISLMASNRPAAPARPQADLHAPAAAAPAPGGAAAAGLGAGLQTPFPGIQQTFGQSLGGAGASFQTPPNVQPVQFANLQPTSPPPELGNIGLLMDVYMELTVELGRTRKLIRDILGIGEGTIIELDKLAGEPVDILVNHKLIAKGEVVVIDENFGVRVTEIVSPMERMSELT